MLAITQDQFPNLRVPSQKSHWVYNGLDCCVTLEVLEVIGPKVEASKHNARTYAFERACQQPAFACMLRGILINQDAMKAVAKDCEAELLSLTQDANMLPEVFDKWDGVELETGTCLESTRKDHRHKWPRGVPDEERTCDFCGTSRLIHKPFNPCSEQQVSHLLHDIHSVPRQKNKKGVYSVDEVVMERIGRKWPKWKVFTDLILECRGVQKQHGLMSTKISPDGRMHSSFSVGKAETGRWASSADPFKDGTNAQNIAEKNRHIFVADPGYKMFYADLEQAESRLVAYVAGDENYIEAHKSGDVHTVVSRDIWPDLPWTGDLKEDKKIAETPPDWDKDHTFRYNCKRNQHGSNYLLTPMGLAALAHIPLIAAREFQDKYFTKYANIRVWHRWVKNEVKTKGVIVSPLGRRRQFFGRYTEDHTIRQAVADTPQGGVADILNVTMWRVWRVLDKLGPDQVQLLAQIHDAILGQALDDQMFEAKMRRVKALMEIPVPITDIHGVERVMTIPVEVATGYNWGKYHPEKNPDGMRTLKL